MNTIKKISAWSSIVLGIVFLLTGGTDIQLGFGFVLVTNGISNL